MGRRCSSSGYYVSSSQPLPMCSPLCLLWPSSKFKEAVQLFLSNRSNQLGSGKSFSVTCRPWRRWPSWADSPSFPPMENQGFLVSGKGLPILPDSSLRGSKEGLNLVARNRDLIVGVPLDTPPPKMHLLLGASRPRAGALTWFRVCGTRTTNTSTSIFWNSRFFLALEEFQNQMMGHSVVLVSDSTTVVA